MFCTFYLNKDLSKHKIIGLHYSRWSSCSLLENFLLLPAYKGKSSSYVHLFLKLCYLTRIKLQFQKLNSYCRAYSLRLPSRASEVESRTQGSRPRPRPRTQKIRGQGQPFRGQTLSRPRSGMLEAKVRDQGHRRKRSPKKKGLQKFFFRRSPIHWPTQNF